MIIPLTKRRFIMYRIKMRYNDGSIYYFTCMIQNNNGRFSVSGNTNPDKATLFLTNDYADNTGDFLLEQGCVRSYRVEYVDY